MKKYVTIHSNVTIQVTCGLQHNDVTNPDAHVPDRLKVSPLWPNGTIVITQGSHVYPSEITTWGSVKCLANDKIITIGSYVDEPDDNAEKVEEKLNMDMNSSGLSEMMKQVIDKKQNKVTKLADIAGDGDGE